jgi:DsbC/DsbD-like thiol-disulfide interchange protein
MHFRQNSFMIAFRMSSALLCAFSAAAAVAAPVQVSPWIDFNEASVRLVLDSPIAPGQPLRGGIEIRMMAGFKTYWRNAGDSGVPPMVTPQAGSGLEAIRLAFPFPMRFDDGAGGTAFGYKLGVILPLEARNRDGAAKATRGFRFDFAVCGTMCIPLTAEFDLAPARLAAGTAGDLAALQRFRAQVPAMLDGAAARATLGFTRKAHAPKPEWRIEIAPGIAGADFALFPDGAGYLEAGTPERRADGGLTILLTGDPPAGKGGAFGQARLVFGTPEKAYEVGVDLDAGTLLP